MPSTIFVIYNKIVALALIKSEVYMKARDNQKLMQLLMITIILVTIILFLGTYFSGKSANKDTENAIRNVSIFYLDELAERREQVVASALNEYITDMEIAINLLSVEDLSSLESLQNYQQHMKQLYDLEKFAFVDEQGLIYTSRGTNNNIEEYNFDYLTLSSPSISIRNIDKEDKKVVIASPVDMLPFEGHTLMVCFMEIDMETMLDKISFQLDVNSTTFCSLYTSDGISLTNVVLGGLAEEDNLKDALTNAKIENNRTVNDIMNDFNQCKNGYISFTYNGTKATMCYVPVRRTNWILTYLIKESIISEQINTISQGIINRNLILSALTAILIIGVFLILIIQNRKASKLAIERETNELMQQELEERIALQDELLEQEKARAQQDSMITALASDYRSVYYVDLDTNESICYRNDNDKDEINEGETFNFKDKFTSYANDYVDKEYRDNFLEFIKPENIRSALANELIIANRYLVHKNGSDYYEMLRMAAVRHPQDRVDGKIHAIGVGFTNIDNQMRESLAKNQALYDALKTAEEASKAKTAFLSNMSHEIRTPMNAIIGLDSLALNEPDLSDTTRDYLEKIGGSAEHLLSLINDILDMSRIESGKLSIKNEEFAFYKLIEQINVIASGQCQDKGLEYNCHISGEPSDYYVGDSTKLRQVMINILGNAVKFTPEGGAVSFDIEKTAEFDGKSTIQFSIKDTGIGMNKEFIPKLFDTFSQEDTSNSTKYGSSGLGMAITKSIVDMMNGSIDVESEKGKGTTFIVSITLTNSEKKISSDNSKIEIIPHETSILVIDDDPIACDHAKMILEKEGFITDIALSGHEAIDKIKVHQARQTPYNLIIVDWQMPEMDGVETTKQIRSLIGPESAIIILTAYNWDDIFEEATSAGVDSFIAKPLFTSNLIEEFKTALRKKKVESSIVKRADLNGKHILLAEDMAVNAQIMIKVLNMKNIQVDHAENGKIAVEMFNSHPEYYYDAILMDMRMPEMDGLEATSMIRKSNRPDAEIIPIIALTANAFDEDVQRSLQAGLNAHLSKPVKPELLFDTLETLIKT